MHKILQLWDLMDIIKLGFEHFKQKNEISLEQWLA